MPRCVEQGPGGDADCFDHQRIALPRAHGVSRPGRIGILGKAAAIGIDLTERIAVPWHHHDFPGCLDHLERQQRYRRGQAPGEAIGVRKLPAAGSALLENGRRLGPQRFLLWLEPPEHVDEVFRDVVVIDLQFRKPRSEDADEFLDGRAFRLPDARQIRLAVEPRGGRGQVRLAVRGARNPGIAMVQPLRVHTRHGGEEESQGRCKSQHGRPRGKSSLMWKRGMIAHRTGAWGDWREEAYAFRFEKKCDWTNAWMAACDSCSSLTNSTPMPRRGTDHATRASDSRSKRLVDRRKRTRSTVPLSSGLVVRMARPPWLILSVTADEIVLATRYATGMPSVTRGLLRRL